MQMPVTMDTVNHLEARIQNRLGRHVRNLQVKFQHNGLVIHGRADTYYAKQLAQHAVMEASTLPILANAIEVI
jgi:hypothetical protein